jgi:lipoprotein-releasing system ATP-binding protein
MIRATGILKSYGDLKVLKGIDLEVKEKEVVAIVGASGAGKTTLLQIIGTLDKADAGKVLFNGEDVSALSQRALAAFRNRHIGFVFQFHQLLPEFTALENVCIPALIAGKSRGEAGEKATSLLSFLGMGDRLDHKPSQLSGGEQQRVAVARAIVNSPSLILADEPSGNLDTENKKELHNLFFRLRDTFGHTFIIVTHDPQLASMSDRTIRIKDGMITNEP